MGIRLRDGRSGRVTPKPAIIRYYVDADLLGLAKLVCQERPDCTYLGDPGARNQRSSSTRRSVVAGRPAAGSAPRRCGSSPTVARPSTTSPTPTRKGCAAVWSLWPGNEKPLDPDRDLSRDVNPK